MIKALATLDGRVHAADGYGVTTAVCGARLSYWTTARFDPTDARSCERCTSEGWHGRTK